MTIALPVEPRIACQPPSTGRSGLVCARQRTRPTWRSWAEPETRRGKIMHIHGSPTPDGLLLKHVLEGQTESRDLPVQADNRTNNPSSSIRTTASTKPPNSRSQGKHPSVVSSRADSDHDGCRLQQSKMTSPKHAHPRRSPVEICISET